tara:strand:- start:1670 stop:1972 length:303 start_codon:yes stop_codon:yes gene_type:complete
MYSEHEFKPFNRYIRIKPIEDQDSDSTVVLVPDGYKLEPKYKAWEVVSQSDACNLSAPTGAHVVVESSMVEEIDLNDTKYYLVLENYVIAILGEPKDEHG